MSLYDLELCEACEHPRHCHNHWNTDMSARLPCTGRGNSRRPLCDKGCTAFVGSVGGGQLVVPVIGSPETGFRVNLPPTRPPEETKREPTLEELKAALADAERRIAAAHKIADDRASNQDSQTLANRIRAALRSTERPQK